MKKIVLLLLIIQTITVKAENYPADSILPTHSKWELSFQDEFSGNKPDETKWHIYNGPMKRKYMTGRYRGNIKVQDGLLKLITKQVQSNPLKFTAGYIWTKSFKQKYGYFEARIRYGSSTGLNNAFWLVTRKTKKSKTFEIDINEGHYPNEIVTTIHTWNKSGEIKSISSKYYPPKKNLSKNFHIYACEWTPKKINIYFDGKKIFEGKNIKCHSPVPVLLSTAVTLFSGKATEQLDDTSMDIDWVRVYKRIPNAPKISDSKLTIRADKFLSWHAASDDLTLKNKIIYKIYLSEKANNTKLQTGFKLGETNGIIKLDLAQIPTNKKYYINVFAFNEAGDYTPYIANAVHFINNSKNPPKPGKQGKININASSWDKINISWAPANHQSSLKYLVYISDKNNIESADSAFKNGHLSATVTGKSFCSVDGLKSGQKLWINIISIASDGSRNNYQMTSIKMPINTSPPFVQYSFTNPENPGEDDSTNKFNAANHGVKIVRDMERYSSVAEFDGKSAFMTVPALNMNSNSATISVWLKIPKKQINYAGIIFSRRETAGLWFNSSAIGYRWPGGCPFNWHTSFKPPINEWFQLIMVVKPDKTTVYMRKDAKLYYTDYLDASHQKCALNFLEIGRDSHKTKNGVIRYFKGLMDDIKIYSRAMTLEEVKKLK